MFKNRHRWRNFVNVSVKLLLFAIVAISIISSAGRAELVVTRFDPGRFTAGAQDEFSACIVNNYPDEMKLAIVQVNSQYSQKVLFKAVPPGEERCLPVTVDGSIVNQSGQANLRLRVERLDLRNSVYFDYIDRQVSVVESGWKIFFAASLVALAFLFVV